MVPYQYSIKNGPNLIALFNSMTSRVLVTFFLEEETTEDDGEKLVRKYEFDVVINCVEAESGNGRCWNLRGHVQACRGQRQRHFKNGTPFQAFYQSEKCTGWISTVS